jgi:hypothetical protein
MKEQSDFAIFAMGFATFWGVMLTSKIFVFYGRKTPGKNTF